MISQTNQRLAMTAMVVVALGAIVLAAIYQDDNKLDGPVIVGGDTATTVSADGGQAPTPAASTGAIEGFLPKSGEASACSEPVGVDLAPGYGAKLTINGIDVAPEEMNVNLNPDGSISNVITASRSLGHYTFKPEDRCPNGSLLRPVDNRLEVCVYRLSDSTERCVVQREKIFDSL